MSGHVKVRFHDGAGESTAGLVVSPKVAKDVEAVARLYPVSLIARMTIYQASPVYQTQLEAWTHSFDDVDVVDIALLKKRRLEEISGFERDWEERHNEPRTWAEAEEERYDGVSSEGQWEG